MKTLDLTNPTLRSTLDYVAAAMKFPWSWVKVEQGWARYIPERRIIETQTEAEHNA
jgi:hypothetical protein